MGYPEDFSNPELRDLQKSRLELMDARFVFKDIVRFSDSGISVGKAPDFRALTINPDEKTSYLSARNQ